MTDPVPSKDQLRFTWTWDANALNWQIGVVDMGDGMVAGYDHHAGYYERRLIEEIERLRKQVEALSIHAEKWVKRALGGAQPPSPIPFAGVAKGVSYEALANATYPERMYQAPEPAVDWLESKEFYEVMQAYRHAPVFDQAFVVERFEAVKAFVRSALPPGDGQ